MLPVAVDVDEVALCLHKKRTVIGVRLRPLDRVLAAELVLQEVVDRGEISIINLVEEVHKVFGDLRRPREAVRRRKRQGDVA